MPGIIRHLRLLLILIAIITVLFLQWRSDAAAEYWKQTYLSEWRLNVLTREVELLMSVRKKLTEPFDDISDIIKALAHPQTKELAFREWVVAKASKDSLVGATFIWRRGSADLEIMPGSLSPDSLSIALIQEYLNLGYNQDQARNNSAWFKAKLDSLKSAINQKNSFVSFSKSTYDNWKEKRNNPRRPVEKDTSFGVIWNLDYYERALLPLLTAEMASDPKKYGLFTQDDLLTSRNAGLLLLNTKGDSVLHYGRVQTYFDEHYPLSSYKLWADPSWKISHLPGWKLYVQDHRNFNPQNRDRFFKNAPHWIDDYYNGFILLFMSEFKPTKLNIRQTWVLLFGAVTILFLLILSQINARDRQRDFIAHISHELRTPVTRIRLFSETLLNNRAISPEKESEYLETIIGASNHLTVLIDNTLSLARLESQQLRINPEKTDLTDLLEEFFDEYNRIIEDQGFKILIDIDNSLPLLNLDRYHMKLVLRNLLDNAVKYSADLKEIEIKASKKSIDKIQITVGDRGVGIPKSKAKAVFKPFFRIKPEDREPVPGAGIGLSIVKEIVRQHKGRVWCESRVGGGTVFTVEFTISSS